MSSPRLITAAAATVAIGFGLACTGGPRPAAEGEVVMAPDVQEALLKMQPTQLQGADMPPMQLANAGAPPMNSGSGLQVLQVAPLGKDRKALQAAVVFDKPMVALSDLDTMTGQVPLKCSPELPGRTRWAGTTTAVFLPEDNKAFPNATAFTCMVPKGTKAVDGTELENEIRWTFETVRPEVSSTSPRNSATDVEPNKPITVDFTQPVELVNVRNHVKLTANGRPVTFQIARDPKSLDNEKRVHVVPVGMSSNTPYVLTIEPGVVGQHGPLASTRAHVVNFRTYPPLELKGWDPRGKVDPHSKIGFRFTTGVPRDSVAEHLSISPEPTDWEPGGGTWASTSYSYWPRLKPRTTYTVRLSDGVTDEYGQKLGAHSHTFETGDYAPWIDVHTGFKTYAANNPKQLPLQHLNVGTLNARMARLDGIEWFTEVSSWTDALDAGLKQQGRDLIVPTTDDPNAVELDTVDMAPFLADGKGVVAYDIWSPDWRSSYGSKEPIHKRGILVVTDLGVNLKVGPNAMHTWVTSLSEGEPVQGAKVRIFQGGNLLDTLTTDAEGHATSSKHPGSEWNSWRDSDRIWAVVEKGNDLSMVHHDWSSGLSTGFWASYDHDGRVPVHHAFTDRGLYRLGDKAYARATFRLQEAEGLAIPEGQVSWTLSGPRGEDISQGKGSLDDRGGFDVEVQLPSDEDGAYGDYSLNIEAKGEWGSRSAWLPVKARAYRAPSFRVNVDGPAEGQVGEALTVAADARYLFGAPLDDVEVDWKVWKNADRFRPDDADWEGFSFGPEYNWWSDENDSGDSGTIHTETGDIAMGRHLLSWTPPSGEYTRPQRVHFEAAVTDHDRQTIAASNSVYVHSSAWYAGLRMGERLPSATAETWFEVSGVDTEGKAFSGGELDVSVVKRTWNTVREKGMDGRWRWESTKVDTPVHTESVTTGRTPVKVSWTPADPGSYRVIAKGKDEAGNTIETVDSLYVVGSGGASWARRDDNRLELIPDKQMYQPGGTAKVLVKAPRAGMNALVTAEREGVLWSKRLKLEGAATALEIPIAPTWKPNVYISVVAVDGAPPQDSPDAGTPEVFAGMTELSVDAEGEHLAVDVIPEREEYGPGETVEVTIDVQRGEQAVANAGVTLYAVDEAVLMLSAYKTPDAHASMYRDHNLMTYMGDNRTVMFDRAPLITKGYNAGGGGGDAPAGPKIRKKFLTTITWQPNLRTDSSGKVKASFELPDNLTTFRIMAVVDAGAESFGSGDEEIRVSRPLIARPALPRFMRTGDEVIAGVVVHNNTEGARIVKVSGAVEGAATLSGSPVEVTVPAMGAIEVPFQLMAGDPGQAKFRFDLSAGDDADAVEVSLPVRRDLTFESSATSGTTMASATEKIGRPKGAHEAEGGLTVDVASTLLVGSGSGLTYLQEYPHGCVEQTTSRAMGALLALQIREPAAIEVSEAELRASVEGTLANLSDFRHSSGALGYWKGSHYASIMGTAYGVEFMGRAKEAGFSVDEALLKDNIAFLRDVLNGKRIPRSWNALTSLSARAYVAVALARAGEGDAGHNNKLFGQARDLSVLGQASLMEAIARTTGPDMRTTQLEQAIASRIVIEPTSASVKENDGRRWARLWGSDDLSTAALLEALLVTRGEHSLAPKLAKHLVGSRKADGRWHNTRGTAAVLASLARYHGMYEKNGSPLNATVALAGKELFKGTLQMPASERIEVPMSELADGDLTLASSGGRLYYEARMKYVPTDIQPRDEGFSVVRTMELLDGEGGEGSVTAGSMLAVTVRVVTGMQRHNVAVVDHLPAGLEPVDTSFATASRAPDTYGSSNEPEYDDEAELPNWGGSYVYDHHELRDDQVRLYAGYMPPGIHTYRYAVRATSPGRYEHPPVTAEEMYEPDTFGRTGTGMFVVGQAVDVAEADEFGDDGAEATDE